MTTRLHLEAVRLVTERKAADYRAACAILSRRRNKPKQSAPPREVRLPYRDD